MVSATETDSLSEAAKALEVVFGKPEANGVAGGGSRNEKQRRVKYWRKPEYEGATDSGWIIVGPEYDTDAPRHKMWVMRGRKELPDSFGKQLSGQPSTAPIPSTMSWEASDEQRKKPIIWLEPLLKAGGLTYIIGNEDGFGKPGSPLIPAEQLVTYGLHRRPGITALRPDLADAVDVECPHSCINNDKSRKVFSGVNRAEAEKSLDQHMAAVHRQSEGARAVGVEVSKQWDMAQQQGNVLDAEKIAQIVAATILSLQQTNLVQVTTPEAKKYPDGKPDSTWKRAEMMSYASDNGVKYPPGGTKNTQQEWFAWLQKQGVTD